MVFEFLLALTYPILPDRPPVEPARPEPEPSGLEQPELKLKPVDLESLDLMPVDLESVGAEPIDPEQTEPAPTEEPVEPVEPTSTEPKPTEQETPEPEPTQPEPPELNPADFKHLEYTIAPDRLFDGVVLLEVKRPGTDEVLKRCTGSLLESGRHILTAATCIITDPSAIQVIFHSAQQSLSESPLLASTVVRAYLPRRARDANGNNIVVPQCIAASSHPGLTNSRLGVPFSLPGSQRPEPFDEILQDLTSPIAPSVDAEVIISAESEPNTPLPTAPVAEPISVTPHCISLATLSRDDLDGDIAVLELQQTAPAGADRYSIYRRSDEKDQVFLRVSYGATGNGLTGAENDPVPYCQYFGSNRYDAEGSAVIPLLSSRSEPQPATTESAPAPKSVPSQAIHQSPQTKSHHSPGLPSIPEATDAEPNTSRPPSDELEADQVAAREEPTILLNTLVYDFDSGSRRHDVLGIALRLFDGGLKDFSHLDATYQAQAPCHQQVVVETLPPSSLAQPLELLHRLDVEFSDALPTVESGAGPEDGGSPAFINGKIAGIAAQSIPLPGADPTGVADGSFGEIFFDTRVSAYATFIDEVLGLQTPQADQR